MVCVFWWTAWAAVPGLTGLIVRSTPPYLHAPGPIAFLGSVGLIALVLARRRELPKVRSPALIVRDVNPLQRQRVEMDVQTRSGDLAHL